MNEDSPALQLIDLTKNFGRTNALNGISFSVKRGECVLLFGPNGSGKTTTFLNIVGIERPSSGKVLIFDEEPIKNPFILKRVSLLTHDLWFYGDLTGLENLRLYRKFHGDETDYDEDLWIEKFGLSWAISRPVRTYSFGMRKRLALLRTFSKNAEIYLLDEPFAGLDVSGEKLLKETINLLKQEGKTLLISTHFSNLGLPLVDRVIVLEEGRVKRDQPVSGQEDLRQILQ